jgi:predicted permease
MLAVFNVAFPVFSLILVGYFCARWGVLGPNASTELNRFVIYLALPALLFDAMSQLAAVDAFNMGYVIAYLAGMAGVFAVTMFMRLRQGAPFVDATIDSLGSAYPNAGFLGIPLCLLTFGNAGLAPAIIGALLTACLLFAIAIVMIETAQQTQRHLGRTLLKVSGALLRNPIMVAPVLGALISLLRVPLPAGVQGLFSFLGAAASPCALVSIGLFLAAAGGGTAATVNRATLSTVVLLKLVVQPALTAFFAFWVFDMPPVWAYTALLLSALPIGTGPFMLCELYGREATMMSRAILLSTVCSLLTISIILALIPHS